MMIVKVGVCQLCLKTIWLKLDESSGATSYQAALLLRCHF